MGKKDDKEIRVKEYSSGNGAKIDLYSPSAKKDPHDSIHIKVDTEKKSFETITKIAMALECAPAEIEDLRFDLIGTGYQSGDIEVIKNGIINPEILNISDWLNNKDLPFVILTEQEKLIVYFNSLNDEGKDRVFEYMELLLSSKQYRNLLKERPE